MTMPKIITNLRDELLREAKEQLLQHGYKNTTIRSVSKACGVAVGTVYNYFESKDRLIAEFVLTEWMESIDRISSHPKENRQAYLEFIYQSLVKFEEKFRPLFSDEDAKSNFSAVFSERHKQLRKQLSVLIMPICDKEFTADFVAEALLTWTMSGVGFREIYELLPEKIK